MALFELNQHCPLLSVEKRHPLLHHSVLPQAAQHCAMELMPTIGKLSVSLDLVPQELLFLGGGPRRGAGGVFGLRAGPRAVLS